MVRHVLLLILGAMSLALSACGSTTLKNVPYDPVNFGPPQAEAAEVLQGQGEAQIAPFDKLEIKVFQVEDLSGEFQVNATGDLQFPLIGQVAASGKTPTQLSEVIAAKLGAKYLRSPKVQVNVKEGTAQTVTVDGVVKEPGAFPLQRPTTLMRAVALAKGLADGANPRRVIVFRTVQGQKMAAGFDLLAIRRAQSEDPTIYPNDVVVVDGRDNRVRELFGTVLQSIPVLAIFRPF